MMNIVDHVTLTNSVRIAANPGAVWRFFDHLEQNYKAWHPQDHVSCKWTKGRPHEVGSVVEAVEIIAGKARKVRMTCTAVQENRRIEYQTMFPLSLFHPSSTYLITEAEPESVEFTALDRFRVPVLLRRIVAPLIAATDRQIKEEGQNLKRLLEGPASLTETSAPVPCIEASASASRRPPSEA